MNLGESSISYDKDTLKAINLTQQKKFKINVKYLKLLKTLYSAPLSETKNLKLEFFTKAQVEQQQKVNALFAQISKLPGKEKLIKIFEVAEKKFCLENNEKFDSLAFYKEIKLYRLTKFEIELYKFYTEQKKFIKK